MSFKGIPKPGFVLGSLLKKTPPLAEQEGQVTQAVVQKLQDQLLHGKQFCAPAMDLQSAAGVLTIKTSALYTINEVTTFILFSS